MQIVCRDNTLYSVKSSSLMEFINGMNNEKWGAHCSNVIMKKYCKIHNCEKLWKSIMAIVGCTISSEVMCGFCEITVIEWYSMKQ